MNKSDNYLVLEFLTTVHLKRYMIARIDGAAFQMLQLRTLKEDSRLARVDLSGTILQHCT